MDITYWAPTHQLCRYMTSNSYKCFLIFWIDIETEAQKSCLLKVSVNKSEAKLWSYFHLTPKLICTTLCYLLCSILVLFWMTCSCRFNKKRNELFIVLVSINSQTLPSPSRPFFLLCILFYSSVDIVISYSFFSVHLLICFYPIFPSGLLYKWVNGYLFVQLWLVEWIAGCENRRRLGLDNRKISMGCKCFPVTVSTFLDPEVRQDHTLFQLTALFMVVIICKPWLCSVWWLK